MTNKQRRIFKTCAILAYSIAILFLLYRYSDPQVFSSITLQSLPSLALHVIAVLAAVVIWACMAYVLFTCYFTKRAIQKRLAGAKGLKSISRTKLLSYKPIGDYDHAMLRFCSEGIPEQEWEARRFAVQSAINCKIIGAIEHDPKDWGIIQFRARKGCPKENKEVLSDDEL
jgi:hypothetical protein